MRSILLLAWAVLIIWQGEACLNTIEELYNGLCALHGPGMKALLYDDNPQGYCTGIDHEIQILDFIVIIAGISLPCAMIKALNYLNQ